jgi:hypothetical protein
MAGRADFASSSSDAHKAGSGLKWFLDLVWDSSQDYL